MKPAAWVFLAVVVVYSLVAWDRLAKPSPQFHFVDLAVSMMQGRLDTETPRQRPKPEKPDDPQGYRAAIQRTLDAGGWNDWAAVRTLTLADGQVVRGRFPWAGDSGEQRHMFYTTDGLAMKIVVPDDLKKGCDGRAWAPCDTTTHYVSFPPFPAVVVLPLAAVWGYDVNDVLVTILFGALNAVLLFAFLELLRQRGHSTRSPADNLWLTALFAFGTVAFFSSVRGEVWFTALVFGVTFNLLYMLAALDLRHPILAGLMLGFGFATRTPIAFCVAFFAWQLFFPGNRWVAGRWPEILKKGAMFAAPVLAVGIGLMLFNHARFDSVGEFGHSYLSGGAAERIRDHGMFSTHYLNGNLSAALTNMPRILPSAPFVQISKHGLGLLVTVPVLFLLFRPAAMPPIRRAFWLAVACAAIPGLLYQNSGWVQFSYRFALDYFPYLIGLLALGARPLTWRVKAVILVGIAINLFGAITFNRFDQFYY